MARRHLDVLLVLGGDRGCRPEAREPAGLQVEGLIAQRADEILVVRHDQDGAAGLLDLVEPVHALALERRVADREDLVDDQDLRIEMHGDGEREPGIHAAGIGLHRPLEILADVGEAHDVVELALDLGFVHAEQLAVDHQIVVAAELGVEAGAKLDQRRDAAIDLDAAGRRLQGAGNDLQQRRLAGAVAADDADRLPLAHLEIDPLQHGGKLVEPLVAPDHLHQPVRRLAVDVVALADAAHADRDIGSGEAAGAIARGHRRTPSWCA